MNKFISFLLAIAIVFGGAYYFNTKILKTSEDNSVFFKDKEDPYGLDIWLTKEMPGDTTGKWHSATMANPRPISEYIQYYYKTFMVPYPGTHVVVNFTLNTTTIINDFGSFLNLDVYEYYKGEENDATICPSGMFYLTEHIDKETWKVTETIHG